MPIIDSLSSLPPERGSEMPKGRPTWYRRTSSFPMTDEGNSRLKDQSIRSIVEKLSLSKDLKADSNES